MVLQKAIVHLPYLLAIMVISIYLNEIYDVPIIIPLYVVSYAYIFASLIATYPVPIDMDSILSSMVQLIINLYVLKENLENPYNVFILDNRIIIRVFTILIMVYFFIYSYVTVKNHYLSKAEIGNIDSHPLMTNHIHVGNVVHRFIPYL